MSKNSLLWLGSGDLASRATAGLASDGYDICAVSRSAKNFGEKVTHVLGDIKNESFLESVLAPKPDYIVMTLTPGQRSREAYQQTYVACAEAVKRTLDKIRHKPKTVIFVSSTSVYHQDDGEWVNESTETRPRSETAKELLKAENILSAGDFNSVCLRFSGIYGEGRNYLLKQALAGKVGGSHWSNRIHADDCSGVIRFLVNRARDDNAIPPILLASDHEPVIYSDIFAWLRKQMDIAKRETISESDSSSRRNLNKRCDSSLLRSLGYTFKYPTFQKGYRSQIELFKREQRQQ